MLTDHASLPLPTCCSQCLPWNPPKPEANRSCRTGELSYRPTSQWARGSAKVSERSTAPPQCLKSAVPPTRLQSTSFRAPRRYLLACLQTAGRHLKLGNPLLEAFLPMLSQVHSTDPLPLILALPPSLVLSPFPSSPLPLSLLLVFFFFPPLSRLINIQAISTSHSNLWFYFLSL